MARHMQGRSSLRSLAATASVEPLRRQHNQDYRSSKPPDDEARLSLRIGNDTLCNRRLPADVFRICAVEAVEAVVWQRLTVTVVPMSRELEPTKL